MWTANHSVEMVGLVEGEDIVVSYLPLSHIAAQILDIFIPVTHAATIYFAQPDALKVRRSCHMLPGWAADRRNIIFSCLYLQGSLGQTLKEVRHYICVFYLQGSLGETLKEVRHYIFVFISSGIFRRVAEGSETLYFRIYISRDL